MNPPRLTLARLLPLKPATWGISLVLGAIALLLDVGKTRAQFDNSCFLMDDEGRVYSLGPICQVDEPEEEEEESSTEEEAAPSLNSNSGLQITLSWESIDDLNLSVSVPDGSDLSAFSPNVASGGTFEGDANSSCAEATGNPTESVTWGEDQAPIGEYTISAELFFYCQDSPVPIPFTIEVETAAGTQSFEGIVSEETPLETFTFELSVSPESLDPDSLDPDSLGPE